MVIQDERGWLGADGKYHATAEGAHESFARRFARRYRWPKPAVSRRDRAHERRLRVFLAHANEDKTRVRELYERLRSINVDPWLDEVNLIPGQKWRAEISKAIRGTDAFVACFSLIAVSKVGYINRELKDALEVADEQPEGKIFLIPLRLETVEVPERFREIQWVDYFDPTGFEFFKASLTALAEWLRRGGAQVALPT
jgi:hypothetical protein